MARPKAFDPEEVLDRALILFWKKGYEHTSMCDLIKQMGISRQSMYDTYGDKHQLFLRTVDRYRERAGEQLKKMEETDAPLEAIRIYFQQFREQVMESGEFGSCMIANTALELGLLDPSVRDRVQAHLNRVEQAFHRVLMKAQDQGSLEPGKDLAAIAAFLTSSLHGLGIMARGGLPRETILHAEQVTLSVLS